jgi:hypothetical protein
LLVLDSTTQFCKCVAIDTCVDGWALRQEFHKQNAFSVPKHCAYDLASWNGLCELFLYWRICVPPFHGLLLRFRGYVRHPCLVPWDYTAQEVIVLLTVSCQKCQRTSLSFHFMFICKILRHPAWTEFPKKKKKAFRYIFVKKWREIFGKCTESDEMVNRLFYWIFSSTARTKSSLTTDGRQLRGSSCSIFASFIKVSHPSPYHWITHGIFSIHLTKLTMNVSRFRVSCIQETDYRPHFTCGGLLDFLEHCKHTGRCVNVVRLSANCVHAFQKDQQTLHTCAP